MRNKTSLYGLAAVIVIGIGFYFLLWSPSTEKLDHIAVETAQLEDRRGQLGNEVARLREIERDQEHIRAELARLETYIPTGTAQPEVVEQFQQAADEAGVEIVSIAFAPPELVEGAPETGTPETSLARIPVTMSIDGGYFEVADFFRRVEAEMPRAVYLGDLDAVESEEGFPQLQSTWIGDLFAVVPTAAIPPAPAPGAEGAAASGDAGSPAEGEPTEAAPAAEPAAADTDASTEEVTS